MGTHHMTENTKAKSKGGRNAIDGATDVVRVNVTMTPEQHEYVKENGGSPFVRKLVSDHKKKHKAK